MTLDELREGDFDTVLLAIVDMQGRLQGKRLTRDHFLSEIVPNNAEGCNYLLAGSVINTASFVAVMGWRRRRSRTRPRRAACWRSRASWAWSSAAAACG